MREGRSDSCGATRSRTSIRRSREGRRGEGVVQHPTHRSRLNSKQRTLALKQVTLKRHESFIESGAKLMFFGGAMMDVLRRQELHAGGKIWQIFGASVKKCGYLNFAGFVRVSM